MPLVNIGTERNQRESTNSETQGCKCAEKELKKKKKPDIFNVVPVERHKTKYPACFVSKKTARMCVVRDVCNTFQETKDVWNTWKLLL